MPKKAARRIKRRRTVKIKTKLVCAKCRADWKRNSNPAICPVCQESSFGIAVKKEVSNGSTKHSG